MDEYESSVTDYSDLENAINQVEAAVERVEAAVKDSKFPLGAFVVGLLVFFAVWDSAGDWIHSKTRYSLQYGVPDSAVLIEPKHGHECAFLASPLGFKFCRYDRIVETEQITMSHANTPIRSIDDGNTWEPYTPEPGETVPPRPTVKRVYVTWKKVDDE